MVRGFAALAALLSAACITHAGLAKETSDETLETAEEVEAADDGQVAKNAGASLAKPASIHWQFGLSVTGYFFQRASFKLEPMSAGERFAGTLTRTNLGPSGGIVIFEPGYVISNGLILGLHLDLGSGYADSEINELKFKIAQSAASLAVGPRVEYLFLPEQRLRPFVSMALGYTTSPTKQADQGLRLTMYQAFGAVGLSYFAAPSFSFDTAFRAAYGIGSGWIDSGVLRGADVKGSVYTLMWTVGTSGWLR